MRRVGAREPGTRRGECATPGRSGHGKLGPLNPACRCALKAEEDPGCRGGWLRGLSEAASLGPSRPRP